jgi:hypothetical protein
MTNYIVLLHKVYGNVYFLHFLLTLDSMLRSQRSATQGSQIMTQLLIDHIFDLHRKAGHGGLKLANDDMMII